MKKKLLIGLSVFMLIGLCCFYYYYPRKVSFELAKEIQIFENFRLGTEMFLYIEDKQVLMTRLYTYYNINTICKEKGLRGLDSIFVENLSKELDFEKYDYLITYQKQIKELRYSPHLTKTEDFLGYDKQLPPIPLIPTLKSVKTNKIYIYKIKKSKIFRASGP